MESKDARTKENCFEEDDYPRGRLIHFKNATYKDFMQNRQELKPRHYGDQTLICALRARFADIQILNDPNRQYETLFGGGFLYSTVKLGSFLFGVVITTSHLFFQSGKAFDHGFVRFDVGLGTPCEFKILHIETPAEHLYDIKLPPLEELSHIVNDYAFVVIEISLRLFDSQQALQVFKNAGWGFGTDYNPTQIFYDNELKYSKRDEKYLRMLSPLIEYKKDENGIASLNFDSESETGTSFDPVPSICCDDNIISKVSNTLTVQNILSKQILLYTPSTKGQSGALIGIESEDKKKFYPIAIHLGDTDSSPYSAGLLIRDDVIQLGNQVQQKIKEKGESLMYQKASIALAGIENSLCPIPKKQEDKVKKAL